MRICLSIRRRFRWIGAKRNRTFIVLTLLIISGLYWGYQRGSLSWTKRDSYSTHSYGHLVDSDQLANERIYFGRHFVTTSDHWKATSAQELEKDNVEDLAHDETIDEPENNLIQQGVDPETELLTQTTISDGKSDDNESTRSKSLRFKSLNHIITRSWKTRFPHPTAKTTSTYKRLSIIRRNDLAGRKPSSSSSNHDVRLSYITTKILVAKKRKERLGDKISEIYSNISIQKLHEKPSEVSTSNWERVTRISKELTPAKLSKSNNQTLIKPFISNSKKYVEISEEIPLNRSQSLDCPQNILDQNITWSYGKCVPHQASEESCQVAKQAYKLDPSLTRCRNDLERVICEVKVKPASMNKVVSVRCNKSLCNENTKPETILVLSVETKDGFIKVARKFQTVDQLEESLPDVIKKIIQKNLHFVILRCTLKGTKTRISQLLPIDPLLTIRKYGSKSRDKNQINVNILLIDSVSRAHFYRSLPKTIEVFKTWKNDPKNSPAEIFDFELFQAIEGHTAENTHALFTGKLFQPEQRNSRLSINPGNMFGNFSKAGYQTMWQEDLCWVGGWGLMIDLAARRWKDLEGKIQNHYIDHTGITHSSCEILVSLGVNSPFFGPLGNQICYNGHFQHSYLLQYTLDTIKAITSTPTALPLLSYMSLSVGHDHIGRRIQSLDPALVEYVNELSLSEDTITIMLSDHGNTYTSYTVSILEGRFEMFHPHLFVIIPNKVARRLGKEALNALRINQHRLVNIIDLHHSIMALSKPLDGSVSPSGLFTPISTGRTCDNLELRMPNLCVCQGWNTPASNDSLKIAFVEFAVGQLNNKIEEKIEKSMQGNQRPPFRRSCIQLYATRFDNVHERQVRSHGSLTTSMDIYVPAGDVVEQDEDVFHVEIKSYELQGQRSLNMKLIDFDRMTQYGKYGVCADQGVPLKLCICSKPKSTREFYRPRLITQQKIIFLGQKPLVKKINECVFLLKRQHFEIQSASARPQSFGFELVNACVDVSFNVSIDSTTNNIKLSRKCPFIVKLTAASVHFLLSAKKDIVEWEISMKVNVKILSTTSPA